MILPQPIKDLLSRRCGVIGLGISNLPLIDFLLAHGAQVTARDKKIEAELGEAAERLRAKGVELILGADYLQGIFEDVIFRSPGLRPDLPELEAAKQRGAVVTSEMELFFSLTPAYTIGITGSDGKTTTTTLTAKLLEAECQKKASGRVYLGGNIGQPLLPCVEEMTPQDYAVVELSSFQLMDMTHSPRRAAITNLSPNHMDWHRDSMAEYANAKANIFLHPENEWLVTNAENAAVELAAKAPAELTLFSSKRVDGIGVSHRQVILRDGLIVVRDGSGEHQVLKVEEILLRGEHNLENYMTAIGLTWGLVSTDSILQVARSFRGVRHRLEPVRSYQGVQYYNSSIDSTPTRTMAALSAMEGKPIVICGGRDKHVPFDALAAALKEKAKAVVLTGEACGLIFAALERASGELPIYTEPLFADAVNKARALAEAGDSVLLSPACTSFDAFRNFEERGDAFCSIVNAF